MSEKYTLSNVPVGTQLQNFGDVIHKLIASAPWHEGDKVAAQQIAITEFGHPTPIKELSVAAATAVQQNEDLKRQIADLEKRAAEREKALNDRLDKLAAAFSAKNVVAEGAPSGSGSGATVEVPATSDTIASAANEEAQSGYAAWKAKQEQEKEQ